MSARYSHVGKQVLLDGQHFADARDEPAAILITASMNAIIADPEFQEPWRPMSDAPRDGTEIEVRIRIEEALCEVSAVWWLNLSAWRLAHPNGDVGQIIEPVEWRPL